LFAAPPAAAQPTASRAPKPTKQECVGANESAQDLQNAGKLRDAEAQLEICTSKGCPGVVRDDCAERLRQVQAAIPTVVFLLRDPDGLDVGPSAVVEMDGAPLPAALDGTPIAIDPGDHTFTFTVAGRTPVTRRIALHAGERLRRDVQMKADAAEGSHAAPGEGELGPQPPPAPARPSVESSAAEHPAGAPTSTGAAADHVSAVHVAGYAAFGAGGAGFLLSAIFGAVALSQKSSLLAACTTPIPGHRSCPGSQQSEDDAFKNNLVAGNVGLIVGFAGVAAGSALLFLWPQDGHAPNTGALAVAPWVGLGAAGMGGTFR
jgi:hypothetical protein